MDIDTHTPSPPIPWVRWEPPLPPWKAEVLETCIPDCCFAPPSQPCIAGHAPYGVHVTVTKEPQPVLYSQVNAAWGHKEEVPWFPEASMQWGTHRDPWCPQRTSFPFGSKRMIASIALDVNGGF